MEQDAPRPKSDKFRVKNDGAELGKRTLRRKR